MTKPDIYWGSYHIKFVFGLSINTCISFRSTNIYESIFSSMDILVLHKYAHFFIEDIILILG